MAIVQQQEETIKRNYVKENKPYVYEKMLKFDDKLKRGESIAIIQFQYSYACNFNCVHCSIKRFQGKSNVKRMTLADVRNVSKQADELGLARFVITGGEPLIFKDFDGLVEAINPQKFYINCDTNGWFLDRDRVKHLKDIGVDRVQLSIDSLYAKEHDEFRRKKGAHYRAMWAVQYCLEEGLDVFIQTVVNKQRLHSKEFMQFVEYFNDKEVGVFVTFAKPIGSWEGNLDVMINKDDILYFKELEKSHKIFNHLTSAYGQNRGCAGCWNIVSLIGDGGYVQPCPYFHASMGSIFEEPLSVILDRCMRLKPFKKDTCLLAEDREFVDKYLVKKIYGKPLPVRWQDVFTDDDFLKESK